MSVLYHYSFANAPPQGSATDPGKRALFADRRLCVSMLLGHNARKTLDDALGLMAYAQHHRLPGVGGQHTHTVLRVLKTKRVALMCMH